MLPVLMTAIPCCSTCADIRGVLPALYMVVPIIYSIASVPLQENYRMRNAMLGAHPEAGSGVANHNSSSAKEKAAGLAPMDVMAQDVAEEEDDIDEDTLMADAEQKVWVYYFF